MLPDLFSAMRSPNTRHARNNPTELHCIVLSHSSIGYFSNDPVDRVAALLTSTSSRFHFARISDAAVPTDSSFVRSREMLSAWRLRVLRLFAKRAHFSESRDAMSTVAP